MTNACEEFLDRVFKALERGTKARAPPEVEANIRACSQNPDTNNARLLRSSVPAWTLVRSAIVHDKGIESLLEYITSSDLGPLTSSLEAHESCFKLYEKTFATSQRASKRKAALEATFSDARLTKRSLLDPEVSNMVADAVPNPEPETSQYEFNAAVLDATVQTRETNGVQRLRPLPDAAVLPLVFPQKMCDGVFKEASEDTDVRKAKVSAHIVVHWLRDPTQCSLNIGLTTKGASTVADKIWNKCISYNQDEGIWFFECDDGVEMSLLPGTGFLRCNDIALKTLLGVLVATTFDNNPQRRQELKQGDRMTRLLRLTLGDETSPCQLQVSLDAEMLRDLERHLWPPY